MERPGGQGDDLLGVGDLAEDGSLEEEGGADEVGSAARALAEPWIGAAAAALPALERVTCPLLGIWGERDVYVPVAASVERFAVALGGPATAPSGSRRWPTPTTACACRPAAAPSVAPGSPT